MKKSIKYAGIAAATLLTVAPIAAPVVSQATTTAATGTDVPTSPTTDEQISGAVSDWQSVFVNKTFGSNSNNNGSFPSLAGTSDNLYTKYNQYMTYDEFKSTALAGVFNSVNSNDENVLQNDASAQIKISASGYSKKEDFKTFADSLVNTKGSITFTYTIQYNDADGNQQTTAAKSFTLTNSQATSDTSIAATFTTPYEVATGTNTAAVKLSTSTDFALKNKDGDKLTSKSITMGPVYKNLAAAKTNGGTTDVYTKNTLDADTYYQPMTINLNPGQFGKAADGTTPLTASDIITGYNNGTDDYVFTVNGGTPTASNANYVGTTGDQVTVIRQIKVADNNSAAWTTEDVSGVVTTKSDTAYKTLVNDDNNTIANRALAANTPWRTDKVRTNNVTGAKQYRVATGEWVNADDVTFAKDGDATGAYTDKQSISGTVHLENKNNYYFLYDDNGNLVTSRGLNGDSDWHTDTVAKNASGVTVYRVATNEWVQVGTGVSFK